MDNYCQCLFSKDIFYKIIGPILHYHPCCNCFVDLINRKTGFFFIIWYFRIHDLVISLKEKCMYSRSDFRNTFLRHFIIFLTLTKVIYPKYTQHWPYTVDTHNWLSEQKNLNHGLNHGFFLLLFKLTPCPIHWMVYVLAYLNFILEF